MIENQQVPTLQTDMELIDILYMQDIDIGIGRDVFDNGYWLENGTGDQKKTKLQESTNQHNETKVENDQSTSEDFPQMGLGGHYVVDNETGELVLVTSPAPCVSDQDCNQQQYQSNDATSSVPDTPQVELLQPMLANGYSSGLAFDSGAIQLPSTTYERQSSLDQHWNDIFSIIEVNSTMPEMSHHTVASDLDSFDLQSDTAAAVVQNASMNWALEPIIDDSYTSQTNFSMPSPSLFPNHSSGGLDSVSLHVFPQEQMLPAGYNYTVSEMPNTVFSLDQLGVGLFDNLNLATPLTMESGEVESFGKINVNFTVTPTNTNTSNVYNMNEPNISHNQTFDLPALALDATVNEVDIDNAQTLLHQMFPSDLADDLNLSDFMEDDYVIPAGVNHQVNEEDWSSDSAVSSMASPVQQIFTHIADESDLASEGGATGGISKYELYQEKIESDSSDVSESSFPFTYEETFTGSSNFTNTQRSAATSTKHVFHNHTYPLPHGRKSREEIEEEARREKEDRATRSRDEKRAKAMKIPLTMDEIIDTSVEEFTELLTRYRLTDAQQQLVRDIRRRGKNKMAAQNCRKRKMEVIQTIEDEVASLRERRDTLRRQRGDLDRNAAALKDKFKRLESELFRRLRDESGREYDPNLFALLQTEDGGVFIVPRTNTTSEHSATSDKSQDDKSGRKRKSKRKE